MAESLKQPSCTTKSQIIHRDQLPLSCPLASMEIWNAHPKIYLPIEETGKADCPYCGTHYVLAHD